MVVIKILKRSFLEVLSICKILGTAILLLLAYISEGAELKIGSVSLNRLPESYFNLFDGSGQFSRFGSESDFVLERASTVPAPAPGDVTVCEGGNATFPVSGGTISYQWQVSTGGGAFADIPGQVSSTLNLTGVTTSMSGNQYRCVIDGVASTSALLTVNPVPVVTTSSTANTCSGSGPNINLTASAASTFSWVVGTITGGITGASAGAGSTINQVLTNPSNSVAGTVAYIVTPTSITGSCTGTPYTITVTVNPVPIVTTSSTATACSRTAPNINLTASVASTFSWVVGTISGGITGASAGTGSSINQVLTNPSNSVAGTVAYIVTPTSTVGTCAGTPLTITVTVNPAPVVLTSNTATICSGSSTNINLTASIPSSFNWTIGTITGGITGAGSGSGSTINQVLTNPGNVSAGSVEFIVVPTSATGVCDGAAYSITVTVNPSPVVTTISTKTICSGSDSGITLTASTPSSYTWTIGTITGGITGANPGSGIAIGQILTNPGSLLAGSVIYTVTPTSSVGSCAGASYPITVTVDPAPVVTVPNTASICSGSGPNIALTASVSSNFTWTIGTITGGITGASAGSGTTINQVLTNPSNTVTGTVAYIVTPTSSVGSCTGVPYTITVTVNPAPVVTTANTATICSGTAPNIGLIASIPSSFTWTVGTITGGITGASSGSGSTINQILTNPSNTASGTVAYNVTPTSTTGTCTGSVYTITVTVNPAPVGTTVNPAAFCSGSSPNVTLSATIASNFSWTIGTITGETNGASSGSGSIINQTLTSLTGGTVQYLVTPTSTSGLCPGSPQTITVTVTPIPVVINSPTASVCSGSSPNIALTASVPSNFTWTLGTISGGITGASAGSGSSINQVLTNPGNISAGTVDYIVTPTASTGSCVGSPFTITVTVNPIPVVTSPSTASICSTTSPNIALTATTPSTFSWTIGAVTGGITGASSGNGATINQVLTNPSNTSAGTVAYVVTPTSVAGGCPGAPYTITVTVNPSPVLTSPLTYTICSGSGSNISLTASPASTFTWTVGTITGAVTGASSGSGGTINQTLTNPGNSAAGTVEYLVTPTEIATGLSCAYFSVTVTVNPTPVVTNSATASTCSGTSPNIALTASVPCNFSWTIGAVTGGITGVSAGSGTTINQVLNNPSNSSAGTVEYLVTPTSSASLCAGTPYSIVVTVNPAPTVTTPVTATICSGTSPGINLTASAPSNFAWTIGAISGSITGAASGSGSIINQVLTNPSSTTSGTVAYIVTPTATNGSCAGSPTAITVTVDPTPVVTTSASAAICSETSPNISLTASVTSTFTWTVGTITGGITGASAGSGNTINQVLTNPGNSVAGTVVYLVTATSSAGSCASTPYSITVTVYPKPLITNNPTTSTCSGTSPNITLLSTVPSSFTWTVGTITGSITGASAGSGTAINQVLTNPSNATSGTVAYIVTPTSTTGSCVGTPFTITVTVNPSPVVTTATTATICSGINTSISLTASVSSSFTWTLGNITGGITGAAAGSGSTIIQALTNPSGAVPGTVEYNVIATSTTGSCAGSPITITVTVNPAPSVTNPATTSICSGTNPNISLTSSMPSTFAWTIGSVTGSISGASAGSGSTINQTLTNPSNSLAGIVEYVVTPTAIAGSCPGAPYSIFVTVNPKPLMTNAPTASTCSGTSPNITLVSSAPSSFTWTVGTVTGSISGASAGSGPAINQVLTNPSNTVAGTVAYIVTPTSTASSCMGTPFTITVTVNPAPVVTTASTATICSGNNANISLTASAPSSFTWTTGTNIGGITGASGGSGSTINQTLINPSNAVGSIEYLVTPTSTTGSCSGVPYSITVTVNPAPTVTTSATAAVCSGTSPNTSLTATVPSTFAWTVGTITGGITGAFAGSGSTINQTLTNPGNSVAGTVDYIVTPTASTGSCAGTPYTITVTVYPKPIINNAPTVSICSGTSTLIGLTASTPSSFTWTIGAITGSITGASAGSGTTINQVLTNPGNTTSGTVAYIVTPTSTSGSCAGTPFTITVTVNPTPVVTTANTTAICSGSDPNITLAATVPSNFTWTIGTISGSITGATAGSGTTISQVLTNPSTTVAGTVEYLVTPAAATGSCAGATYVITVTVYPTPVVTNAGIATVCNGTSPNISLTATVPSTFAWTIGTITGGITGASAGSGSSISQTLTNPDNSAAGTVAYIVTPTSSAGSCTGAPYTITVTVNPAPAVTSPASATICNGTSPTISLTASLPSTFAWTVGTITGGINGASAGSGSTISQILTNPSNTVAGTVAYIVTPTTTTGSCAGTPFTITVTVTPAPAVTTANTATICSGTSPGINLTASLPSGFTWTIGTITGGITGASAGSGSTINQTLTNPGNIAAGSVDYIVTPTSTAGSCPGSPYTITVSVNPAPAVTTPATASICSGSSPNINLTASMSSTFAWTVGSVTGGITGASAGSGNLINQTLTNPDNSAAGTVAYIVTPTASATSCAGAPFTITVTVYPKPVVTNLPSINGCSGTTNSIPLTASAPSNFTWTVGAIIGGVTGASAGSGTTISQVLTNPSITSSGTVAYVVTPTSIAGSCVGAPFTITVTIYPTPTITTANTATICNGTSPNIALTASVPSNFTWTIGTISGSITGASAGSGSTINQILTNPGNLVSGTVEYIVTPTATTGLCVGSTYVITVTVNPTPVVTTSNTAVICSGTSTNINLTASAPSNFTWTVGTITGGITGASAGSGSSIGQTLTNPSNSTAGTVAYIVTPTAVTGSCSGAPYTITVTVNPTPVLTSSLSAPDICSNSLFSYNPISSVLNTTFNWTRAAVPGVNTTASGTDNPNEILVNTSGNPANVTYVYTLTANGCTNPVTYNVVVTVTPLPTLSSTLTPTPICSNTAFNYTPTSSDGIIAGWTRAAVTGISNPTASGATNPNETLVNTTASPVNVTYVYTITSGGCSNSQNVVVTVNPNPVLSGSLTPSAICSNSGFSYTPASSTTGTIFNWSRAQVAGVSNLAASGIGNPNETLVNTTAAAIPVTYTYQLSANGCNSIQNVVVSVNPMPVLTSSLTPLLICSNTPFIYTPQSYTVGTTFTWSRPTVAGIANPAATGSGNPNETLLNLTASPVNVTYIYTLSANGCTNPVTYNVVVTVTPLPTLSSTLTPTPVCSNTVFNYTPTSSDGIIAGWTRAAVAGISNAAASGTANPNETLVNTTASPVNVTYVYTVTSGGCSNSQNVVVTVNPNPVLSGTLTPSAICSNSVFSYTPASFTTGTIFNWSRAQVAGISNLTASGVGNPNETLVNTTAAAIPVTYTYQLSANGCNSTQNVVVSVDPSPVLTSSLTPLTICSNTPFIYTPQSSTVGTIFAWSRPSVAGIANPASSGYGNPNETLLNLTASPVNVTYIYTLSANGCTNPITYNVVVTVNPAASLSSSLSPAGTCSGTVFNYSATSSTVGAVMTWTRATVSGIVQLASGGSGNISEFLTNSTSLPVSVTYQYTLSANGCTNIQNVVVVVNPSPVLSSNQTPPAICSGTAFHYAATSATSGTTFTWTRAGVAGIMQPSASGTGDVNETLTNTTNAPVIVNYTYNLSANSCSGSSYNVAVTVNPTPPTPVISPSGPTTFCTGSNVVLTAPAGYRYQWSNGATTQSITVSAPGSFSVVVRDAFGCQSAASATVTTSTLPSVTSFAGSDGSICAGTNFTVSGATASNYASLFWTSSGTGTFMSNGTLTPTYIPSALDQNSGTVILTLTASSVAPCVGSVHDDLLLVIQPQPTVNAGSDQAVCFPSSLNISGASATTYQNPHWIHNGSGVLVNAGTLTPTYYPAATDVGNTVMLTLTVDPLAPCLTSTSDVKNIQVSGVPGNPGAVTGSATVCKGGTVHLFNSAYCGSD